MPAFCFERRRFLCLAIIGLAALPRPALAQASADLTAPIRKFYTALLGIMQAGRATPFTARFNALAPVLEQAFNLPAILQAAVGLGWSGFPPAQQSQLQLAFQRYTVASWVSNFDTYSGQKLEIAGSRSLGSAQVVHTEIAKTSGAQSVIDYVMRQAGGTWRVSDVLLDGSISQVALLRSDFRQILARGPLALAADLERKTTQLMGETAPM